MKNILPQFAHLHGDAGSDEANFFIEIPFALHIGQDFIFPLTPVTGEFMEAIVLCQAFSAQNERRNKFRLVTIVMTFS